MNYLSIGMSFFVEFPHLISYPFFVSGTSLSRATSWRWGPHGPRPPSPTPCRGAPRVSSTGKTRCLWTSSSPSTYWWGEPSIYCHFPWSPIGWSKAMIISNLHKLYKINQTLKTLSSVKVPWLPPGECVGQRAAQWDPGLREAEGGSLRDAGTPAGPQRQGALRDHRQWVHDIHCITGSELHTNTFNTGKHCSSTTGPCGDVAPLSA